MSVPRKLTCRSAKSRTGGAEIVLPHRTCSPTNSRQPSTCSATHRTSGASTGNLPYRIRVVLCSREHAITSTMSPERSGNSACSVAWTARCGTPASSVLACCSSSFRNRMVPVELSLLGFTLQLHFQDNPNRIWSDAFATSLGRATPAPPRCHEIATGRVRLLTA